MIRPIREKINEISRICAKYRVKRLELFGSASGDDFSKKESDIDLLVEFLPLNFGEYADSYFGLLFDLEDLLGRPVDLIMPGAIKNRYFLEAINENRKAIYAVFHLFLISLVKIPLL